MILTINQFNDEINSFHSKYSDKWSLLSNPRPFHKDPQLFLKMTLKINPLQLDSYIVYSYSYQVPVLYFLPLIDTEESARFAKIDELKQILESDPGSIDLAENPINGLVMYHVHPCLTSKFMKEIIDASLSQSSKVSLIESWLSFCPLIPIKKSFSM